MLYDLCLIRYSMFKREDYMLCFGTFGLPALRDKQGAGREVYKKEGD